MGNANFFSCNSEGSTYLTGFFRGELNFGNGVILPPISYDNVFVISYSPEGDVEWTKGAASDVYNQ